MSCPHSRHGSSSSCSQCVGAVPHVVKRDGVSVTVDGAVARAWAITGWSPQIQKQRRRGGMVNARNTRKRPP